MGLVAWLHSVCIYQWQFFFISFSFTHTQNKNTPHRLPEERTRAQSWFICITLSNLFPIWDMKPHQGRNCFLLLWTKGEISTLQAGNSETLAESVHFYLTLSSSEKPLFLRTNSSNQNSPIRYLTHDSLICENEKQPLSGWYTLAARDNHSP